MAAGPQFDLSEILSKQLAAASPDVLRELMTTFVQALMGAEADALCGAGYRERSSERTNSRNGYRDRDFDTRLGTLNLRLPKLREGSYFPDWLSTRPTRTRSERSW